MIDAFQTLKDQNNPKYVRENGPFECTDEDAWMHNGYYFWDEDIKLCHWWGRTRCRGEYLICKTSYELNDKCWDIYGKYAHREELIAIFNGIRAKNINSGKPIKVRDIVEYLTIRGLMKYEAMRMVGTESINKKDPIYESILLQKRKKYTKKSGYLEIVHLLELRPPIQICFFNKNGLNRKGFQIVYPDKYTENDEYVF